MSPMYPKQPKRVSAKSRERLRKESDKLIKRTLELANMLYATVRDSDSPSKEDIKAAFSAHAELLPYIKPKLQAIAPAEMDAEGNINAIQVRRYYELLEQARQEEETRKQLEEPGAVE